MIARYLFGMSVCCSLSSLSASDPGQLCGVAARATKGSYELRQEFDAKVWKDTCNGNCYKDNKLFLPDYIWVRKMACANLHDYIVLAAHNTENERAWESPRYIVIAQEKIDDAKSRNLPAWRAWTAGMVLSATSLVMQCGIYGVRHGSQVGLVVLSSLLGMSAWKLYVYRKDNKRLFGNLAPLNGLQPGYIQHEWQWSTLQYLYDVETGKTFTQEGWYLLCGDYDSGIFG